jgi:hypothetical protein
MKKLVLVDDCFSVVLRERVLAELCCFKGLASPVDSYRRMSEVIPPNSSVLLFDNKLSDDPVNAPSVVVFQTRGYIVYASYPDTDGSGVAIDDTALNLKVRITDNQAVSYDIPFYLFHTWLGNPVTTDNANLLNMVEIVNDNDFSVSIEVLMVTVHRDGVSLSGYPSC